MSQQTGRWQIWSLSLLYQLLRAADQNLTLSPKLSPKPALSGLTPPVPLISVCTYCSQLLFILLAAARYFRSHLVALMMTDVKHRSDSSMRLLFRISSTIVATIASARFPSAKIAETLPRSRSRGGSGSLALLANPVD